MDSALLVIDYINGIVHGSCKAYLENHPAIEKTNQLIAFCRSKSMPIYFIRLAFDEAYSGAPKYSKLFGRAKGNGLYQLGRDDVEFIAELDFQPEDSVLNKTAVSPFHGTDLQHLLAQHKIEKIIFSGISTDNAINIGVREAHDLGYYTVIAEDACGGATEEFHRWSITMLDKIANEILSVDEIIAQ